MGNQEVAPVSAAEAKALFGDLRDSSALVLAVSGGPDSTALMVLAARWARALRKRPTLIAVTVDHGLRPESAREAATVKTAARRLGIEHHTLRWTGRKPTTGLQKAAREARYRLLGDAARKFGACHILTAHTLDDQAETVLIRLTRGSGLTGLAAMKRLSILPGRERGERTRNPDTAARGVIDSGSGPSVGAEMTGNSTPLLVRPLLDVPKARLLATLKAAKIPFADDPSNRDPRFTRVRIRGLMAALGEEGLDARRLSLLSRRVQRADAALETAADQAMAALARPGQPGRSVALDAVGYSALPDEIALRLLGRALAAAAEGPVGLAKLEALKEALESALKAAANARLRRTLAGALITLAGGKIEVRPAPPRRDKALTTARGGKARPAKMR